MGREELILRISKISLCLGALTRLQYTMSSREENAKNSAGYFSCIVLVSYFVSSVFAKRTTRRSKQERVVLCRASFCQFRTIRTPDRQDAVLARLPRALVANTAAMCG
eukprot:scaffold36476_cov252-Amphora_coffeaeformis.AAC.6